MWRLADRQLDEFISAGRCELIAAYAQPFSMLVVADVLGVPEEDHPRFREGFGLLSAHADHIVGGSESDDVQLNALDWIDEWFTTYIEDRPRRPAQRRAYRPGARYLPRSIHTGGGRRGTDGLLPLRRRSGDDGSTAGDQPEVSRRVSGASRGATDPPRTHTDFLEETLRIESPVKADFRLARRASTVAGVDIAPGTPVMLLNGAANRDARRFECPTEFHIDRPNAKEHIAFGRGAHSCPGGPLARAEARISVERILDRFATSDSLKNTTGQRRIDTSTTNRPGCSAVFMSFT